MRKRYKYKYEDSTYPESSGRRHVRRNSPKRILGGNLYKYPSDPDISRSSTFHNKILDKPFDERFRKSYLHEFTTVDELGYFRRKTKPPDLHTKSQLKFNYNFKSEPSIPLAVSKSEYNTSFKPYDAQDQRHLLRRSTSLKLEGDHNLLSEQRAQYVKHDLENWRRPYQIKHPDNLKLSNNIKYLSEYKTSYMPFESRLSMELDSKRDPLKPSKKYFQQLCNLKLEGEQLYNPEYRSQFKEHSFPLSQKSLSIPQISHINFNGNGGANETPEYRDRYRYYADQEKLKPIKKLDNLNLFGYNATIPEYRERYREYNRSDVQRVFPIIKNDTLNLRGEFTKDLPEYYESYKNYNISSVPEKAKPRKPYLNLSGHVDYYPEYRSTYLDFPRARPIIKKPHSNIHFVPAMKDDDDYNRSFLKKLPPSTIKYNIHDPDPKDISSLSQPPELRKAQVEFLKRERNFNKKREIFTKIKQQTPIEQINLDDGLTTTPFHTPTATETEREESSSNEEKLKSKRFNDPSFRLMVENVDQSKGSFKRTSPRFINPNGSSKNAVVSQSNTNNASTRNRSKIIEGNHKYFKGGGGGGGGGGGSSGQQQTDHLDMAPSFVILDDPQPQIKPNKWMKSSGWYDR